MSTQVETLHWSTDCVRLNCMHVWNTVSAIPSHQCSADTKNRLWQTSYLWTGSKTWGVSTSHRLPRALFCNVPPAFRSYSAQNAKVVKRCTVKLTDASRATFNKMKHRHQRAKDEFCMVWLPGATHRKKWHKMTALTAACPGWSSETRLYQTAFGYRFSVCSIVTKIKLVLLTALETSPVRLFRDILVLAKARWWRVLSPVWGCMNKEVNIRPILMICTSKWHQPLAKNHNFLAVSSFYFSHL